MMLCIYSVHRAAVQVIQLETSHVQMDILSRRASAPNSVQLSIDNAKTRVIAVGVMASGKIALALAIKSVASHAGMVTKTKPQTIVPMKRNLFRDNVVVHRQIVINIIFI